MSVSHRRSGNSSLTISDVIRASKAQGSKRELSPDELGAVRGGGDAPAVPHGSPYYDEFSAGQSTAETGSNTFWTAPSA